MSDLSEPEVKRKGGALEVGVDPADRLELRFLHDVGSVDASAEPGIEPQANDTAQIGAMALEKAIERGSITGVYRVQETTGFLGIQSGLGHGNRLW